MKIRKKPRTLVRTSDDRWFLCEKTFNQNRGGEEVCIMQGEITDVTDSVKPYLNGTAEYVRRLETATLEMHRIARKYCPPKAKEKMEELIDGLIEKV